MTNIPSFKDDRQDSQDIINKIEAFIPSNLKFVIKSFRKLTDSGFLLATPPFQAVILINISTSEGVSDFIDSYCSTTKETLRCSKIKSQVDPQDVSNHQFIFKKAFRCHHNTRTTKTNWKPDKRSKNTECPFVLTIKIHNSSYKKRHPAENNFDPNFPCEVHFSYDHNHNTQILQALTFREAFREVSQSSKDVYLHLFKDSKTPKPSLAQAQFKKLLRNNTESAEDYEINFADRQQKPRLSDAQRLYESFNSSVYGGRNGESLVKKMLEKEEEYNTKYSGEGGVMKHIIENADDDKKGNFILAIALVTPLMARSHTMICSSGEQVFIDGTSNLEELHLHLFLLRTHSPAGGLPLGVIITSDEMQATLEMAFSLSKDCLPENSFYGRGKDLGPISFLSDNNDEERKALNAVWPDSVRLLCVFHLLQAIWRWLMDKQNGISSADRPEVIKELRHIVHAESQESLEKAYENFVSGELGEKYNNLLLYFDQFV